MVANNKIQIFFAATLGRVRSHTTTNIKTVGGIIESFFDGREQQNPNIFRGNARACALPQKK